MYGGAFCCTNVMVVVKYCCNNGGRICTINLFFLGVFLSYSIGMVGLPILELLSDAIITKHACLFFPFADDFCCGTPSMHIIL